MARPKNISKGKVVQKQASERVKKVSRSVGFRTSTSDDGSVTVVRRGSKYDGGDKYSDQAVSKTLKNGLKAGHGKNAIKGVQDFAKENRDRKRKKK